jgi:predicted nucleic acid-binding protein
MILLDNNIVRKYSAQNPDPHVVEYLATHYDQPWGISAIVLYEFLSYYEEQSTQRRRHNQLTDVVDDVLAFDEATAVEAASMESSLATAGVSLDAADLLIAATARQHGATLATADTNDFDKTPVHELLDLDIVTTS